MLSLKPSLPTPRSLVISAIAAAVLTIPVGAWLIIHTKPIPGKYRQGLNYPLYYPANLPSGYTVNRGSFQRKGNVLIFNIQSPSGKNIAVSEQHIPKDLDLSQHANPSGINLPDQRNLTTPVGPAQISFWGDKLVSSLVTENTWVILNVSGFKMDDAAKVTQSFTKL